ncbi:hypothetical protein DNTS_017284 [Danionella cerebrum]|uniref:Parathyroid hormone n=1 Tax=Danionella cerebrum TaxID=2873325 RepID=A0A553N2T4_9TELE|nr:hypothetical protein DNTS_017284 [Danionella translucida]
MDPHSSAPAKNQSSQIKTRLDKGDTMLPIRFFEIILIHIVLWSFCSFLFLEGLPISKRSISEVQLMHNVREHKEMLERQDWLQLKLNNIIIPSSNDSQKEPKDKTNNQSVRRSKKVQTGS